MSSAAPRQPMSIASYLTMEAAAAEKHILWEGEVFAVEAMAGGTIPHGIVCANVVTALGVALSATRCRVMTSDVKVWVPRKGGFVYPDASVVCGRPERYPGTTDTVTNPLLLVEVLSEGTERFDRGEKFDGYRAIASLRHYLMVSTEGRRVEHYARAEGDAWMLRAYGPGEHVSLATPDITLSVDALFRLVDDDDG